MGGPRWQQTKSWGCWESRTEMKRICERDRATKIVRRREENVSASAEQKNRVRKSCKRGEIAFSFHFTCLPFLAQPSSFTSRPLLHTPTHTYIYTQAPHPYFCVWAGAQHECISVLELPPLILDGRCSVEHTSCGWPIRHRHTFAGRGTWVRPLGALDTGVCTQTWPKHTPAEIATHPVISQKWTAAYYTVHGHTQYIQTWKHA